MLRVHVIISGRVQHVFFRANTKRVANELSIKGWVRNLNNEVEAVFEGEDWAIKRILEFCKKGPTGAKVDKVKVNEETYKGEFDNFEIRY